MNVLRILLATLIVLLAPSLVRADLVVVVGAGTHVPRLTRDEVTNIFLGRYRQLPGGLMAVPADLPVADPERAKFYRLLVGKEQAEINAYWSRLVFSGKTTPPRLTESADEMARFVAATAGGIGYLDRSRLDARLKIVTELER